MLFFCCVAVSLQSGTQVYAAGTLDLSTRRRAGKPRAFRGMVRRAIVNPIARCSGVCQLLLDFGESECDFSGLHDDAELLAQLRQR